MNKQMKTFLAIVLVVVAGLVIWKYTSSQNEVSGETMRVAVNPWIGSGLYYVAEEQGFFKAEGLDVKLTDFADGSVGKQLISTSQVDAMVSLTPETVQVLNDAGTKVKIVAVLDTSDGADGIIAGTGINTVKDLKGKSIAYEEASPSHFLLSYLLDKEGMSISDIRTVNQASPDAGASFIAGKVDAAVTWEPWLSKAKERKGGRTIVSTKDLNILPGIPIFRADVVEQRPEDVKRFITALFKARDYITANPDASYDLIARRFNITKQDVVDQIGTFSWLSYEDNVNYFDKSSTDNVYNVIDKAGDLWLKLGLIKTKANSADVVDFSILEDIKP